MNTSATRLVEGTSLAISDQPQPESTGFQSGETSSQLEFSGLFGLLEHNLRSLMTTIELHSHLIQIRDPAGPCGDKAGIIRSANQKMVKLTNDLVMLMRIGLQPPNKWTNVRLDRFILNVLQQKFVESAERSGFLNVEKIDAPILVNIDPVDIRTGLLSLIESIQLLSQPRAEIFVNVGCFEDEAYVSIESRELAVSPKEIDLLLSSSFNSKIRGDEFQLALSFLVAKAMFEKQNGHLTFATTAGNRLVATVTFPITE